MGRWLVTARGGMLGMVSRLAAVVMALAGLVLGGIGASNALPAFANGLGHGGASTGTSGWTSGHGNNSGHIQVNYFTPVPNPKANHPHISCGISVEFYGFDIPTGASADISIIPWSPTPGTAYDTTFSGWTTTTASGSVNNGVDSIPGSDLAAMFASMTPQPEQGYHVRVKASIPAIGWKSKKIHTIWLQGCAKPLSLQVVKTNNASGNGFAVDSTATGVGETVPFEVKVTNTSTTAVDITKLTDAYGTTTTPESCTIAGGGGDLVGSALAAGASATCTFTIDDYAPAAGRSLSDTVTVNACQSDDTSNCTDQTGTSTVTTPPAKPKAPITLAVTKTNNASGGGYAQSSTATGAGETVPFQVTVTNTSPVPVLLGSITDQWPGQTRFSPNCTTSLDGVTLAPEATATCDFRVRHYAPAAGSSRTDTVTVSACQKGDASNCASGTATSTVTTPSTTPSQPLSLTVVKTNEANHTSYAQSEVATGAHEDVPFRATITNHSTVAVTITSLTDQWPDHNPFPPSCDVVGKTVAAGAHITCDFTVDNYAPAAGTSRTDTVVVTGCQVGLADNCTTSPATSTVTTPGTAPSGSVSLTVVKTNDAGGTGYAASEVAPKPQAPVPFEVTVTNTSAEAVTLESITDQWPGLTVPITPSCAATFDGTVLASGASATCAFTLSDYAPPAGQSLTDTAVVKACSTTSTACGTGTGTSTVTTADPAVTLTVTKTNEANGSSFAQSEQAAKAGQDVPFEVTVTNPTSVPVTISSITDQWPGRDPFSPTCAASFDGTVLDPSSSATCSFTVSGYAPGAGGSRTDTAIVTACQSDAPGNCGIGTGTSTVTSPPSTKPLSSLSLTVTKTNDADGSGAFAPSETSTGVGKTVEFEVTAKNTSAVPVTISSITDQWPGRDPFSPPCAASLDGEVLQPGDTATCTFSVTGYTPAAGSARSDVALVTICQQSAPGNCTTGSATSTVSTPPAPVLSGSGGGSTPAPTSSPNPTPALSASGGSAPSALAFTGAPADLWLLVELGLSLAAVGFFLLWVTRPRRPAVVQR